jgi:hypothetical protein
MIADQGKPKALPQRITMENKQQRRPRPWDVKTEAHPSHQQQAVVSLFFDSRIIRANPR